MTFRDTLYTQVNRIQQDLWSIKHIFYDLNGKVDKTLLLIKFVDIVTAVHLVNFFNYVGLVEHKLQRETTCSNLV